MDEDQGEDKILNIVLENDTGMKNNLEDSNIIKLEVGGP